MDKPFTWEFTATLTVSDNWVADGFDLTIGLNDFLRDMMERALPYAREDEVTIKGKILRQPPTERIAKVQGFSTNSD